MPDPPVYVQSKTLWLEIEVRQREIAGTINRSLEEHLFAGPLLMEQIVTKFYGQPTLNEARKSDTSKKLNDESSLMSALDP